MLERDVLHRTTVHKQDLLGPGRASDTRLTDKSVDRDAVCRLRRNFEQLFKEFPSPQISNTIHEGCGRRRLKHNILLPHEYEADLGTPDRLKDQLVLDMTRF